jgi:hypothetical protein
MHGGSITNSTISGNSAVVGGGIYSSPHSSSIAPRVEHSTIAFNTATIAGGAFIASGTLTLNHTILAANRAITAFDIHGLIGASATARYCFIGDGGVFFPRTPIGSPDANGNLVGGNPGDGQLLNPRLAPLADNGGPTKTHTLFADSLAIDAGDPAAMAGVGGVPQFDQRGAPFTRVHGGRIDMGAFEAQPNPLTGDYNLNGVVDTADAVVWRKTLNSTTDLRADGNGDGVVDQVDWQVWRGNFGLTAESGEQGAESGEPVATYAPPHRPAWHPAASPGVSVSTFRPAFRPPAERFAPDDDLLDMLASPRAASAGREDFTPLGRQAIRDLRFDLANPSVETIDRVFETLGNHGASAGWAPP